MTNFDRIMDHIFKWEGGYVNHEHDPGGETNFGISKKAHPEEDIKNMTKERAREIYKKDYWDEFQGDKLPSGIAAVLMDYAVNAGVYRAVSALQQILGLNTDGEVGPITRRAVEDFVFHYGEQMLMFNLNSHRRGYYLGLMVANPDFRDFKRGWENRVRDLEKNIMSI